MDNLEKRTGLTQEERTARATLAARTLWDKVEDRTAHTLPGRTAFMGRFEKEVDPEGVLDSVERARRAEQAKKAYFVRLSSLSSKNSRSKSGDTA